MADDKKDNKQVIPGIGSERRKTRLVELMREEAKSRGAEGPIEFSEEEIVRFAATRHQIDGDY